MPVDRIQAIDVHAHYGEYHKDESQILQRLMSAEPELVVERARSANTELTFVSPTGGLLPAEKNDAAMWNANAKEDIGKITELRFWVIVDPGKPETYSQAEAMLKLRHCIGIKIHPESHGRPIAEYGKEVMKFALEQNAIVLSHSGNQNSVPEEFAILANEFPEVVIIIAHLGNSGDGDLTRQVDAVQKARNGNLYVDTSSSMSIVSGLIEWAVEEIGSRQILYGTDSPLYFAPTQRSRIDDAEMEDGDKRNILRENALRLFKAKIGEET